VQVVRTPAVVIDTDCGEEPSSQNATFGFAGIAISQLMSPRGEKKASTDSTGRVVTGTIVVVGTDPVGCVPVVLVCVAGVEGALGGDDTALQPDSVVAPSKGISHNPLMRRTPRPNMVHRAPFQVSPANKITYLHDVDPRSVGGGGAALWPILSNRDVRASQVKIGAPVDCRYHGGNRTLGRRGRNLWVEHGKIGHGEFKLKYAIPLSDVSSVDVTERIYGGSRVPVQPVPGMGVRRTNARLLTDITVRTKDGQEARWVVQERGADWVRGRLAPVLQEALIPFYDDVPPSERSGCP